MNGEKRICMISYSFYENDNRVMRYAEALAKRGDHIDIIALRKEGQPKQETWKGVRVYRIQHRSRDEKGKFTYLSRILKFLFRSMFFLTWKHLHRRYHLVHVHSVPDFEVFAACLAKLLGAKVILDIHDILPEFYTSKFGKA